MNKCKEESSRKGRKPKGGKLVIIPIVQIDVAKKKSNIILHLRCSMNDLEIYESELKRSSQMSQYNPILDPEICYESYNSSSFTLYNEKIDDIEKEKENENQNEKKEETILYKKIRQLKISYHNHIDDNMMNDNKSACFWCTYHYSGINYLIPKHIIDGEEIGYGSFCSPECATAFLLKENIDDSSKFERYHLLNSKYSNRIDTIKPSPDPHYMLDKFYGNLSIHEYRNLVTTNQTFVVIDKPLTRILPELYEENEKFNQTFYGYNGINNVNLKTITSENDGCRNIGSYKVKRQSDIVVGPSKNSIMKRHFKL